MKDFAGCLAVKTLRVHCRSTVRSGVGELRSCMLSGEAKKIKIKINLKKDNERRACGGQMVKISQRSPSQCQDPAPLNNQQAAVLNTLCQKTSKKGTQSHPLAERLPKILRPQTPQNTPPDVDLPTRKTRSSLIHQNTGTSPLHQEAYTTH